MKNLNSKKNTNKPEIPGKVKKGYRAYVAVVLTLTLMMCCGVTAFAAGDTTQNLHEVMIALQTASVSFQEMVQVRNKLVTAYQDVMSMQV